MFPVSVSINVDIIGFEVLTAVVMKQFHLVGHNALQPVQSRRIGGITTSISKAEE
jgi:hypothetical protein